MPYYNVHFVAEYFSMTVGARANNGEAAIIQAMEKIQTQYGWNLHHILHELQTDYEEIKGLV